ncbi:unnamed protein product [Cuscuta epithymum]|nr:unnamed protein product [Cuscuta epithymum]
MQCLKLEENHTEEGLIIETEEEVLNLTKGDVEEVDKPALETLEEEDNDAELAKEEMTVNLLSEAQRTSSNNGFLNGVITNSDGKTHSQWYEFFRKLKKGPGVRGGSSKVIGGAAAPNNNPLNLYYILINIRSLIICPQ